MKNTSIKRIPDTKRTVKIILLGFLTLSVFFINENIGAAPVLVSSRRSARSRRPFMMPLKGEKYHIYQPLYDQPEIRGQSVLFASPDEFVKTFLERLEWARPMVKIARPFTNTPYDQAVDAYLEIMISVLSGMSYNDAEKNGLNGNPFSMKKRKNGLDLPLMGDTMIGVYRLRNIKDLLKDVIEKKIPGGFMETGVWRGGSSVFARAVMDIFGEQDRLSILCDSFHELRPGDNSFQWTTDFWSGFRLLEVPSVVVGKNFKKYGLLSENVIFANGFFTDTMPLLSARIDELAILRLDGDTYSSIVDVLHHMYAKVSVGGYIIVNDWNIPATVEATYHFLEVHGINVDIIPIDTCGVYFKKTEISVD